MSIKNGTDLPLTWIFTRIQKKGFVKGLGDKSPPARDSPNTVSLTRDGVWSRLGTQRAFPTQVGKFLADPALAMLQEKQL